MPVIGQSQIFNQPSQPAAPPPSLFEIGAPPPPPPIIDTPIDGGVIFLLIIGVALGVRRLANTKNNSEKLESI